jgi:hypothetical protein
LTSSLDIGRAHIHGNSLDPGGIAAVLDQCLGKGPRASEARPSTMRSKVEFWASTMLVT